MFSTSQMVQEVSNSSSPLPPSAEESTSKNREIPSLEKIKRSCNNINSLRNASRNFGVKLLDLLLSAFLTLSGLAMATTALFINRGNNFLACCRIVSYSPQNFKCDFYARKNKKKNH